MVNARLDQPEGRTLRRMARVRVRGTVKKPKREVIYYQYKCVVNERMFCCYGPHESKVNTDDGV